MEVIGPPKPTFADIVHGAHTSNFALVPSNVEPNVASVVVTGGAGVTRS